VHVNGVFLITVALQIDFAPSCHEFQTMTDVVLSRRRIMASALSGLAIAAVLTSAGSAQAPAPQTPAPQTPAPQSTAPPAPAAQTPAPPAVPKRQTIEQSRAPGLGASGYDVVAYFTQNAAVPGKPEHIHVHDGVTWRFSSPETLAAFKAEPAKYTPQYGGYCAWAVASNYTATSDPEAFSIVDGKLYLNYSRAVRFLWARDPKGNIVKGNANWPNVLSN
jgi:YHS domain-containing protein